MAQIMTAPEFNHLKNDEYQYASEVISGQPGGVYFVNSAVFALMQRLIDNGFSSSAVLWLGRMKKWERKGDQKTP